MIHEERLAPLNDRRTRKGRYVLYWMQASQRAACNHALEYAAAKAGELSLPLVVFFGLTERFPGANMRHYAFMLEGLREVARTLEKRGIRLVARLCSPEEGAVEMARQASFAVTDMGYLDIQRRWRSRAALRMACPLVQVESDAVVPVETASGKAEFSAATFRPKLLRQLDRFLLPPEEVGLRKDSLALELESLDLEDPAGLLARLSVDGSVRPVAAFHGGTSEAVALLDAFIREKLPRYGELKNDPSLGWVSHMSPYLHFGQVSPLFIARKVLDSGVRGSQSYLEELLVRRELSLNHLHYNPAAASYDGLPAWARKTLEEHGADPREHLYPLEALEEGRTHDPYWNAAQKEMRVLGKMHGYMRMYWGKKILEWSATPREAFATALALNDRYELDGRDPNGITGAAWCFGLHDRPWGERAVFGKVRYMNDRGLRRKFDIDGYVRSVERACGSPPS